MMRFMEIGIEKLERAKTMEQVDKIEEKTCSICCYSGVNFDGGCDRCPFEAKLKETRERIKNKNRKFVK